ncbi:hypothetical protein ACTFH7_10065 [Clostridium cagae]|uniref:hypothetical protein n=1 Tax=Clostridium cagae TaxID=2080751 RepID=UPI003F7771E2
MKKAWNYECKLEMLDILIYVLQTGMGKGKNGIPGLPMSRCPHCEYITDGVNYFPESLWCGKNQGRKYGDYSK